MPFELQPVLKGELVSMRPLLPSDREAIWAVASDPMIWEQHPVKTRCQPEGFAVFFQESIDSGGALLITDLVSGEVIGSSRYHGYDESKSEIEIGWTFLARSHWGGTHNRELKRLMLSYAFQFVDRVLFLVGPTNFRSQKAVLKIGGVRDGSRTDASGHESYLYAIDKRLFTDNL